MCCDQDWGQVTWARVVDLILSEFRVFLFLVCTAAHVPVCLSTVCFLVTRTRQITTTNTFVVFSCRYAQQPLVGTVEVTSLFILTPLDRMIATEYRNLMLFVLEVLCATWCDAGKGRYQIPGEEPVLISVSG